jgi:Cofactor assembly of complex C subunit B
VEESVSKMMKRISGCLIPLLVAVVAAEPAARLRINAVAFVGTSAARGTRKRQQKTAMKPLNMLLPMDASSPSLLLDGLSSNTDTVSSALLSATTTTTAILLSALDSPPETGGISYSKASYYTILGLYLMSFPGLWSQIKRSTTAKVKRKTYVSPGENSTAETKMSLRQQAGEIMACKCCFGVETAAEKNFCVDMV